MQPRDARVDESFDEDLKKALEMSLEEVKGHSGAGYVPQSQLKQQSKPPANLNGISSASDSDEDDELKAAIAASLQDMEEQKRKHARALKEQTTQPSASSVQKMVMPKPDYELTPVEAENINLFSTLVDRLQHQPPGTILREPQIQELYESIGALRPKLARTYGETMSKHGMCNLLDTRNVLTNFTRYVTRTPCQTCNGSPILRPNARGAAFSHIRTTQFGGIQLTAIKADEWHISHHTVACAKR